MAASSSTPAASWLDVHGRTAVKIIAHHKAGEHVAWAALASLCCPKALQTTERLLGFHLGMCLTPPKGTCAKLGVGLEFNGLRPQMRFNANHTYIHFIRHPVSMIVSGYLYHRRCPEAWTKQARLLHTHPNVTDYWSGYGNSATAGLFWCPGTAPGVGGAAYKRWW